MATAGTVASQVTALHQEVRELRRIIEAMADSIGIAVAEAPRHAVGDDGEVFVPGTGWTGSGAPEAESDTVDRTEALANVRELRSKMRGSS